MKTIITIAVLLITQIYGLKAQDFHIYKNDGEIISLPLRLIDSITFGSGLYGLPCSSAPTVTDIDGNIYNTVQIGLQCWMKENLKTTKAPTGVTINRNCYDDNPVNCALYGGMYSWFTVMNGQESSNTNPSGVQGICPDGWHVPSLSEWIQLQNYVFGQGFPNSNVTETAGNALKSCRQVNSPLGGDCNTEEHPRWNSHTTNYGFDIFGFSGLPGGFWVLHMGIIYVFIGKTGNWWSSTTSEYYSWTANSGVLYYNYPKFQIDSEDKDFGLSLRCVKD